VGGAVPTAEEVLAVVEQRFALQEAPVAATALRIRCSLRRSLIWDCRTAPC
jgi:hypothetical protein